MKKDRYEGMTLGKIVQMYEFKVVSALLLLIITVFVGFFYFEKAPFLIGCLEVFCLGVAIFGSLWFATEDTHKRIERILKREYSKEGNSEKYRSRVKRILGFLAQYRVPSEDLLEEILEWVV
jgi:hypothetical protein